MYSQDTHVVDIFDVFEQTLKSVIHYGVPSRGFLLADKREQDMMFSQDKTPIHVIQVR